MQNHSDEPIINRRQSLFITGSSIISAATTFLVTWLAARSLPPEDGKEFLVFWSLTSLVFATLLGVQQESARLIGATGMPKKGAQDSNTDNLNTQNTYRPIQVAALVGLTCTLIFVALTPIWLGSVLPQDDWRSILIIATATTVYACHVYCIGATAGMRAWTEYALLISTGGVLCLVLSALSSITGAGLFAFQLSFAVTAFLWLCFVAFSPTVRETTRLRIEGSRRVAYTGMMIAVGTAVAIAAMSVGFPVFLEATNTEGGSPENTALLAAIILGISITRAPIMLPLQAFQGVAISYFLSRSQKPFSALAKPALALIGLGAVGAVAAFLIGPWIFDLIYSNYAGQLSGSFLAGLTFAAALLAVTTLSGTAALAMGLHKVYLAGWVLAVISAFLCLLLPLGLESKTILALTVAPLFGFAVHLGGMEIQTRSDHAKATDST